MSMDYVDGRIGIKHKCAIGTTLQGYEEMPTKCQRQLSIRSAFVCDSERQVNGLRSNGGVTLS